MSIKKENKPKQERSKQSMRSLLLAARSVFAKKGFDGARIEEIASLAGVNKQRIYAYFGSKSELYHSVLVDVYSEAAHQEAVMSLTEADIPSLTFKLISIFLEFHKNHPDFWRLLSWENISRGDHLNNNDWAEIRGSYIRHIENLYIKGQKQGIFKADINFSTYILTIFAITYFYYSNRTTISHLLNLDLDTELTKKRITAQVSSLLDNGLQGVK